MRKDRHQEETPTSQLDWHPREPPPYAAKLKILFKKDGKMKVYTGGTRPKPS